MTIFGFNTDIRYGDTVYHVQTEAREAESLLQTALFVRGRCIGKHTASYAGEVSSPDFCEEYVHGLLTRQHRFVVNRIREGKLNDVLHPGGPPVDNDQLPAAGASDAPQTPSEQGRAASESTPVGPMAPSASELSTTTAAAIVAPASPTRLEVEWLASECLVGSSHARLCFLLKSAGQPADGVRLLGRLDLCGTAPIYAQAVSANDGAAQLNFTLPALGESAPEDVILLVQATNAAESVTRKFRLRRG